MVSLLKNSQLLQLVVILDALVFSSLASSVMIDDRGTILLVVVCSIRVVVVITLTLVARHPHRSSQVTTLLQSDQSGTHLRRHRLINPMPTLLLSQNLSSSVEQAQLTYKTK